MKLRNAWVMALALCGASAAYAVEDDSANWYFGLSVTSFDFEVTDPFSESYNTHGYIAKMGYDLGSYISLEGRVGMGDSDTDGSGLSMEAQRVGAAYVRFNLPFDKIKIYALAGAAQVTLKAGLAGASDTMEETGTSYGGGIELYGNRTTALTAEYVRYIEDGDFDGAEIDVNALSFGFVHHF